MPAIATDDPILADKISTTSMPSMCVMEFRGWGMESKDENHILTIASSVCIIAADADWLCLIGDVYRIVFAGH